MEERNRRATGHVARWAEIHFDNGVPLQLWRGRRTRRRHYQPM